MRPKSNHLTLQQIEIMKVVWSLGDATVRDVYETLLKRRPIAYTTVMTTMKIMEERGHLKKRIEGRAYVYKAAEAQHRALRKIVSNFIDRVFNGSAEPLLAHLVRERRISERDLDTVAKMLREKKNA